MQFKSIKTKLLLSLMMVGVSVSACFAENILSQIEISPLDTEGYNITFSAQKPSAIKKIVSSDNKMVLEMKDVSVSSSVNTIYNNVTEIDNVVIEAVSKNNTKVTFEGKNAAKSQIFFTTEGGRAVEDMPFKKAVGADSENGQEIELSRPVNAYAPVYSDEMVEDMSSQDSFIDNAKLSMLAVLKNKQLRRYVKSGLREVKQHTSKENLAYVLLGIAFIALAIKVLRGSTKQEAASIGLSQTLHNRELERNKDMNIEAKIEETRRRTQAPAINANAGYAMKSYRASQKNPYTSSMRPAPAYKKPAVQRPAVTAKNTMNNSARTAMNTSTPAASTRMTSPVNNVNKKINVDSAKFLESMAKIYEKNGRVDLARGLKENIKKAGIQKQTV